ncbi:hypothetical protein AAHC03_05453 [Spirometra sp. Aus1]
MALLNYSSPDLSTDFPLNISTDISPRPIDQPDLFVSQLSKIWKIDSRPAVIPLFTLLILFVILTVFVPIGVLGWVYVRRRKRGRKGSSSSSSNGSSRHEIQYSENPRVDKKETEGARKGAQKKEVVRCLACQSQLQYSMEYRPKERRLLLGIIGCTNLTTPTGVGVPCPIVKIVLNTATVWKPTSQCEVATSKVLSTAVLPKTRNPTFREMFAFSLMPYEIMSTVIHIRVYHFDQIAKNLILGNLEVELKKTPVNNYFGKYYEVQEPLREVSYELEEYGQICVAITYEEKAMELRVNILDAKDLSQPAKTSSLYPMTHVSATLLLGGGKSLTETTAVRKNVINPYFGSLLTFPLKCESVAQFTLKLKLKYHGETGLIKTHGFVIISLNSPHVSGRRHWREVIDRPGEAIGMWHALTCYTST